MLFYSKYHTNFRDYLICLGRRSTPYIYGKLSTFDYKSSDMHLGMHFVLIVISFRLTTRQDFSSSASFSCNIRLNLNSVHVAELTLGAYVLNSFNIEVYTATFIVSRL